MEEQNNFLNALDNKPVAPEPSVLELRLQELLDRKNKLDVDIGNCPICDGRSRGVCGQDHKGKWDELLKEISEAELEIRE